MAELDERIENGLNEARMLLLGGQVLLGFTYRICFEPAFERLTFRAQAVQVVGLGIMTAGMGWLLWPVAFHQIVERGRGNFAIERFTSSVLDWGLLPFALGIGLSLYPVSMLIHLPHPAVIASCGAGFALLAWYGWTLMSRDPAKLRRFEEYRARGSSQSEHKNQSDLGSRIKFVLIECRMALPGAQAFLGFQFAIMFTDRFGQLARGLQWVHFGSLLATTVAIVLLITPAAYHRLAEGGMETEHFHSIASRLVIASLIFLGPGMAGDLLLVIYMLTQSMVVSVAAALVLLLAFYFMWFGMSVRRLRDRRLAEAA